MSVTFLLCSYDFSGDVLLDAALETWLAALLGRVALKVMKKPEMLNISGLMRLSAMTAAVTELGSYFVGTGFGLTGWHTFIIIVAVVLLVLYKMQPEDSKMTVSCLGNRLSALLRRIFKFSILL